jgi:AmiR/NasT family two-component response regulator
VRALTERAKGILMERHSVDDTAAFEMMRTGCFGSRRWPSTTAVATSRIFRLAERAS